MMETHVKILLKDEWVAYFPEAYYETLKTAMIEEKVVEVENLFGGKDLVNGKYILLVFLSTKESRLKYEQFAQMITEEEEDFKKEGKPEWMEGL